MKKFLIIGIIGVLVASMCLVGKDKLHNDRKVNELKTKVFEANTYINNGDLLNAEMLVNIIKKENFSVKDNEIKQEIKEIDKEINQKRNLVTEEHKKTLDNLSDAEKDLELLNIYLENNEVSSDVKPIKIAGKNYYIQYRRKNNLECDENKNFSNDKGYILKSVGKKARLKEDICLVFDVNKPFYINDNVYYKFKEVPVSCYFGDKTNYNWFLANLDFNIVSKENLEFYIENGDVKNYKHETIDDSELKNYLKN